MRTTIRFEEQEVCRVCLEHIPGCDGRDRKRLSIATDNRLLDLDLPVAMYKLIADAVADHPEAMKCKAMQEVKEAKARLKNQS